MAQLMHLTSGVRDQTFPPSYHKSQALTRPDSLPYLFRKLRIHRNLTKCRLAEKISVSESYVYQVENGLTFPSLRYCIKCGELFGANANWVKAKWANEAINRYTHRLLRRLGLDRQGEKK